MTGTIRDYFEQTQIGESRWWNWGLGFWFIFIGWLIAQVIITIPIPFIAMVKDPELFQQLLATTEGQTAEQADALKVYGTGFLITSLLGCVFWALNRVTDGKSRQIHGWLTGISVAASIIFAVLVAPHASDPESSALLTKIMGMSAIAYALFLLVFPATLVGVFLVQKFIHHRNIRSLHTAAAKFRWKRVVQSILIMWAVLAAMSALLHFTGLSPIEKLEFNVGHFAPYAIASLLFIPLQSGTEEIVFRGYLNQGFAHVLKNKWVAFIITSFLFMCMHLANPEAAEGAAKGILPIVMSSYFMFGFLLCIVVYFDNGLEAAIGVHAANNTFAAIAVNYEGSVLPTPSVFLAGVDPKVDIPASMIALGLVVFLLYLTRKPLSET